MSRPGGTKEAAVQKALLDQLYQSAVPMVVASISTGALVAGIAFWRTAKPVILVWLLVTILVGATRAPLVWSYRRALARGRELDVARWQRRFFLQVSAYGICWGASALVLMGHSRELDYFVVLILTTKILGSLITTYAHPPAFFAFTAALTLPALVYELTSNDVLLQGAGLTAVFFMLACTVAVRRIHGLLRQTIISRVEKEELALRITEEKDRALAAQEAAQRAVQAKTHFLAAASHDLRQPLQAQSLFVGALRERVQQDPESLELADRIALTGRSLRSLLDGLLDASKLDAGVVQPSVEDFALQPMLDRIAAELGVLATEKGLTLTIAPTSLWARSDPAVAARIIRNLVANAIQHTDEGSVLVGVRRGTALKVVVYDTGPGIPQAHHESIFEDFVQLANPERDRTKGVGLGLGIVRRLSALISSQIGLVSTPGHGSAFWMTLEQASPQGEAPRGEPTREAYELRGKAVLVIDNEVEVLDAMSAMLNRWDCVVTCADSGESAIATGTTPDVIIADYRLRDGATGSDAIIAIRESCGVEVPALIITGDTDPARVQEARALGVEVLHKPIEPAALRYALGQALQRAKPTQST